MSFEPKERSSFDFNDQSRIAAISRASARHPMFGAFSASPISFGGLLWKSPWRMSKTRKMRTRFRLKGVDDVIATLNASGIECAALDKALMMPTEQQMRPKDKYTVFSRTDPGYRKSLHKVPKWTRLTIRENPVGF